MGMNGQEEGRTSQEKRVSGLTMEQWSLLGSAMAQVGCGTVVVILAALALGLWIDHHFGTRPWATLTLILGSIPLSLLVVARLALQAAKQAQSQWPQGEQQPSDLGPPDEVA